MKEYITPEQALVILKELVFKEGTDSGIDFFINLPILTEEECALVKTKALVLSNNKGFVELEDPSKP